MGKFLEIIRSFLPNFEALSDISSSIPAVGPGWLFGFLGTIAVSLFGLSMGRTRAIISLLSIYVAFAFDRIFPYFDELYNMTGDSIEKYWVRLALFVVAYVVVFFVFNFSFIKKRISSTEFSLFGIIILSILQIGLAASIVFHIVPKEVALRWSFGFYKYFGSQQALFFWAVAPLPAIFLIGKK